MFFYDIPAKLCSKAVLTFSSGYRDGYCRTDMLDHGRHVVCARVTQQFLEYSKSKVCVCVCVCVCVSYVLLCYSNPRSNYPTHR